MVATATLSLGPLLGPMPAFLQRALMCFGVRLKLSEKMTLWGPGLLGCHNYRWTGTAGPGRERQGTRAFSFYLRTPLYLPAP